MQRKDTWPQALPELGVLLALPCTGPYSGEASGLSIFTYHIIFFVL